jgi:RimJ/RimL family protein N-acetyltransferase
MILRKLEESDLPFLLEVRNDESTRQFLKNNRIFTLEESKNWFRSANPIWYIIEIENKKIGYIRTDKFEIGVDIHPMYRRMGYAREAYTLYLKDRQYASLWVFSDNFAKKLYLELGFKETGNKTKIRDKDYIEMIYENRD